MTNIHAVTLFLVEHYFTCLESAQIETLAMFTSISNIIMDGAIIIFNAYSLIDVNIQFYQVIWHLIANYCT